MAEFSEIIRLFVNPYMTSWDSYLHVRRHTVRSLYRGGFSENLAACESVVEIKLFLFYKQVHMSTKQRNMMQKYLSIMLLNI